MKQKWGLEFGASGTFPPSFTKRKRRSHEQLQDFLPTPEEYSAHRPFGRRVYVAPQTLTYEPSSPKPEPKSLHQQLSEEPRPPYP